MPLVVPDHAKAIVLDHVAITAQAALAPALLHAEEVVQRLVVLHALIIAAVAAVAAPDVLARVAQGVLVTAMVVVVDHVDQDAQ